jgi:uncharacterized membrane protein YgcG
VFPLLSLIMSLLNNDSFLTGEVGLYAKFDIVQDSGLTRADWIERKNLEVFLKELRGKNFSLQNHRAEIVALVGQLDFSCPFDRDERFPEDRLFYVLTGTHSDVFYNISSVASYKDIKPEVSASGNTPANPTSKFPAFGEGIERSWSYFDSAKSFTEQLKVLSRFKSEFSYHTRKSFEKTCPWTPSGGGSSASGGRTGGGSTGSGGGSAGNTP